MFTEGSEQRKTTLHICPACLTANARAFAQQGDQARCRHCHALLLPGVPVELNETQFDRFIALTPLPVVANFWASWCGPCRAMTPHFARAASRLTGSVHFVKVNTDHAPALAMRLNIRAIPTLLLYHNGAEVKRTSGVLDVEELVKWLT